MMYSVTMQWDADVLKELRQTATDAPLKVKRLVGDLTRGPEAQALIVKLAKPAPKPTYPIQWKSPRQRKFVMAKLRREHNLPYKRTGKLERGWRVVVVSAANAEIAVENSTPYTRFVQGDDAQPFHVGRWQQAAPILVEAEHVFQDKLIDGWYRITTGGR